jgi:2-keto-3-deoxy-L-rhamnonate aldolase RhmA
MQFCKELETMILDRNPLKTKLSQGGTVLGTAIFSWSPNMVEAAGYAGLDFIRIDTEHAWRKDSDIEHLIRAAYLSGVMPLVRIDGNDPCLPGKAFEIGAAGIIATEIDSVDAAKALVANSKFPPHGVRGYSGNCWSGGWGMKAGKGWVTKSNSELMIGIMVEDPNCLDQVDDIMDVDGIDFALFGPADYSMALGLGGPSKDDTRVQDALLKTISASQKAGKHVMFNPGFQDVTISRAKGLGVTMIEIGNDIGIAAHVWKNTIDKTNDLQQLESDKDS